jgi:signal transduction histidine kinase
VGTAARLAAFQALLLAGILALVVAGLVHAFAAQSQAASTRELTGQARAFQQAARLRPAGQDIGVFTRSYLSTRTLVDGQLVVVALTGRETLASAGSQPLLTDPRVRAWTANPPAGTEVASTTVRGRPFTLLAVPLTTDTRTIGTLVVAADQTRALADRHRVLTLAVGEAAVALLAGVAAGYLLLRRLLRTIGRITTTAAELGRGDLDRRLGDQGRDDEVGELAATFDVMADRVASAMSAQRRLLSDVSHQLRTPLTVARGHLEVLGRTGSADRDEVEATVTLVVDELDHMRTLVERLLLLGAAMEPDFLETAPLDLRSLLADLLDAGRMLADRHWSMGPAPDLVLVADTSKLRGALLNLLDNAAKATTPADRIELRCALRADGGLEIAVEDSGPGIPAAQRSAAVTRFRRPGAADSEGSGLGLAIVHAVAEAHGGTLELGDSDLGGCRVAVVLPPYLLVDPHQASPLGELPG